MLKERWFCKQLDHIKNTMFVLAMSILKNESDVQDAIQNTLMIAYEHLDDLRFKDKFKPWILRILKNECYKIVKKREYSLDEETITEESKGLSNEMKMTIWDYVNSLDEIYRNVIILYYYEGLSIKDIASTLDISSDNVKKRMSRARMFLKKYMEKGDCYER